MNNYGKILLLIRTLVLLIMVQTCHAEVRENEIIHAVLTNDQPKVKKLLQDGVGANSKDIKGNTLLMIATDFGYKALVELLLTYPVDLQARNNHGNTALSLAARNNDLYLIKLLIAAGAVALQNNHEFYEFADPEEQQEIFARTTLVNDALNAHNAAIKQILKTTLDARATDIHGNLSGANDVTNLISSYL